MEQLDLRTQFGKAVVILIVAIAAVLVYESFIADKSGDEFKPKENQPCEGTAIEVDYPYHGGMLGPHACSPQCDDEVQHFILYTNGKATQCQKLPGCLDWGEDQGVTCVPPQA